MTTIAKLRRDINLGKECVAHWVELRDNREADETPEGMYCPYCREYTIREGRCEYCPIRLQTGVRHCGETPWNAASGDFWGRYHSKPAWRQWQASATAEITFLRKIVRNLQAKLRRREKK